MYPNLVVAQKELDFLDCFVATPIALCVTLTNHLLKITQELGRTCVKGNEHNKLNAHAKSPSSIISVYQLQLMFPCNETVQNFKCSQMRYKVTELKHSH